MIRKTLFSILTLLGICTVGFSAEAKSSVGIVNFANCMSESKVGKQEQESFDRLKTQMTSLIEDTEKQMNDMAQKFNDAEYMDGLSPEAEAEMKQKFAALQQEMGRYQNQYYQVLNQANMKIIQSLGASIQEASAKVAKNKKLTMIMNKEACFFHTPVLDVTNLVIAEMDKKFEQKKAENKEQSK